MSFLHGEYFWYLIITWALVGIFLYRQRKHFETFIRRYWNHRFSIGRFLSFFPYWLAFLFMFLGVLDLREQPKSMQGQIPEQKTIILLDTSASMLVEDVRPNRLKKAIWLTKHFVKHAPGHQVSIMVFSDMVKKLVPFTGDMDLIMGRLSSLEELDIKAAGSNLSMALMESLQYFKTSAGTNEKVQGNLLVITDAEENADQMDLNIPDTISVAMVGVGTLKGGPIPLRDKNGYFSGNKKFAGEVVISKLDEDQMKSFSSKIKSFKYWIATSYSLPTDDILSFFSQAHQQRNFLGTVVVREVKSHYLVLIGLAFFLLAIFLRYFKSYVPLACLLFGCYVSQMMAQEPEPVDPLKKQYEEKIKDLEGKIKTLEAHPSEKLKLAEYYLRAGDAAKSLMLLDENLDENKVDDLLEHPDAFTNKGTALIKQKKILEGLNIYRKLQEAWKAEGKELDEKLQEAIKSNSLLAIKEAQSQEQQKDDKEDQQQKEDKEENKDKKDSSKSDSNKNKDEKKDENKKKDSPQNKDDQDNKQDQNKDKDSQKDDKGKDQKKDQKQNKDQQDKKQDKKDQPQNEDNKQQQDEPQQRDDQKQNKKEDQKDVPKELRAKQKLTPMLKQLINEDKNLQMKMIDPRTGEQSRGRQRKDW